MEYDSVINESTRLVSPYVPKSINLNIKIYDESYISSNYDDNNIEIFIPIYIIKNGKDALSGAIIREIAKIFLYPTPNRRKKIEEIVYQLVDDKEIVDISINTVSYRFINRILTYHPSASFVEKFEDAEIQNGIGTSTIEKALRCFIASSRTEDIILKHVEFDIRSKGIYNEMVESIRYGDDIRTVLGIYKILKRESYERKKKDSNESEHSKNISIKVKGDTVKLDISSEDTMKRSIPIPIKESESITYDINDYISQQKRESPKKSVTKMKDSKDKDSHTEISDEDDDIIPKIRERVIDEEKFENFEDDFMIPEDALSLMPPEVFNAVKDAGLWDISGGNEGIMSSDDINNIMNICTQTIKGAKQWRSKYGEHIWASILGYRLRMDSIALYEDWMKGTRIKSSYGDVDSKRRIRPSDTIFDIPPIELAKYKSNIIQFDDIRIRQHKRGKKFTVILLIDISGSMEGKKIQAARLTSIGVCTYCEKNGVRVGIVPFTEGPVNMIEPTDNYIDIIRTVSSLLPDGGTSISSAFLAASKMMDDNNSVKMILISDTEDPSDTLLMTIKKIVGMWENLSIDIVWINDKPKRKALKLARNIASIGRGSLDIVQEINEMGHVVLNRVDEFIN